MTDPKEMLTSVEAAKLLGIESKETIQNWLEGGSFPGAVLSNGEWRFPRGEVEAVRVRIEQIRERNRSGDISIPDETEEEKT